MAERLIFDRSLYLPEAVEAAATAYADLAHIEVTSAEEGTVAVISGVVDNDPDVVQRAFSNHVLHETIARLRQETLRELA